MKKRLNIFLVVITTLCAGSLFYFSSRDKTCFPIYNKKNYSTPGIKSPQNDAKMWVKTGRGVSFPPPEVVILLYRPELAAFLNKNHKLTLCDGYLTNKLAFLDDTEKKVAIVSNFDLFAPGAVYMVEQLIAYGVKKIIALGSSGSLQSSLSAGSVVICDRAIRDDGVSQHYIKPSYDVACSKEMVEFLQGLLNQAEISYSTGKTWTMSAIYRETPQEVTYFRKKNVLTVEAEAAALFALGQYRNVPIGAIFVISDVLYESGVWQKTPESSRTTKTVLCTVLQSLVDYFISLYKKNSIKEVSI